MQPDVSVYTADAASGQVLIVSAATSNFLENGTNVNRAEAIGQIPKTHFMCKLITLRIFCFSVIYDCKVKIFGCFLNKIKCHLTMLRCSGKADSYNVFTSYENLFCQSGTTVPHVSLHDKWGGCVLSWITSRLQYIFVQSHCLDLFELPQSLQCYIYIVNALGATPTHQNELLTTNWQCDPLDWLAHVPSSHTSLHWGSSVFQFVLQGCVPAGVCAATPADPPAPRAPVRALTMPFAPSEWDS